MSAPDNDTKAAPSLADDLAQRIADHDCGCGSFEGVVLTSCPNRENYRSIADVALAHSTINAALRAVEAVRAFPKTSLQIVAETKHEAVAYAFGYRDGVEAVQSLLEGEG